MSPRPARGAFEGRRRPHSGIRARLSRAEPSGEFSLPPDWADRLYLAIDVETTGLDPRSCRVIELGCLLFIPAKGLVDCRSLDRLVNPGRPIPSIASSIHGIRDEDVEGAPAFAQIAPEFEELATGAILLAHNAPFDLSFIRMELDHAARSPIANPVADSLVLARRAFPGLPSYSLPKLAKALGIDTTRSHRALDDATACALIFVQAARRLSAAK